MFNYKEVSPKWMYDSWYVDDAFHKSNLVINSSKTTDMLWWCLVVSLNDWQTDRNCLSMFPFCHPKPAGQLRFAESSFWSCRETNPHCCRDGGRRGGCVLCGTWQKTNGEKKVTHHSRGIIRLRKWGQWGERREGELWIKKTKQRCHSEQLEQGDRTLM